MEFLVTIFNEFDEFTTAFTTDEVDMMNALKYSRMKYGKSIKFMIRFI